MRARVVDHLRDVVDIAELILKIKKRVRALHVFQTLETIEAVVFPGANHAVRQGARRELVRRVVIESCVQTRAVREVRQPVEQIVLVSGVGGAVQLQLRAI